MTIQTISYLYGHKPDGGQGYYVPLQHKDSPAYNDITFSHYVRAIEDEDFDPENPEAVISDKRQPTPDDEVYDVLGNASGYSSWKNSHQ